ncbi:MAG: hypothetical protein J1F35_07100 [Erysipelotrichales bacterium]|nr:hypothetical protein [Erysipelotrichales bacterium]
MKDVNYEGSITEDIALVNDTDNSLKEIKKSKSLNIIFFAGGSIISYIVSTTFGVSVITDILWSFIFFGSILLAIRTKVKNAFRKLAKEIAELHIKNFCFDLDNDKTNTKMLTETVSYENIKNATVVINSQSSEDAIMDKTFLGIMPNEEDFQEYIDIIISDIYFLDLNNRIRALREIKNIAKLNSKKEFGTENSKLQEFEPNDFPKELPVKQVLRLRNKEVSHEKH